VFLRRFGLVAWRTVALFFFDIPWTLGQPELEVSLKQGLNKSCKEQALPTTNSVSKG
jgi:hypothetical protein